MQWRRVSRSWVGGVLLGLILSAIPGLAALQWDANTDVADGGDRFADGQPLTADQLNGRLNKLAESVADLEQCREGQCLQSAPAELVVRSGEPNDQALEFNTISAALAYLGRFRILDGGTVAIYVIDDIEEPDPVIVDHLDSARIHIIGRRNVESPRPTVSFSGTHGIVVLPGRTLGLLRGLTIDGSGVAPCEGGLACDGVSLRAGSVATIDDLVVAGFRQHGTGIRVGMGATLRRGDRQDHEAPFPFNSNANGERIEKCDGPERGTTVEIRDNQVGVKVELGGAVDLPCAEFRANDVAAIVKGGRANLTAAFLEGNGLDVAGDDGDGSIQATHGATVVAEFAVSLDREIASFQCDGGSTLSIQNSTWEGQIIGEPRPEAPATERAVCNLLPR